MEDKGPLRTAVAKAIFLPCGDERGIDSWSLEASGGENFDKRCRDFGRRQNRGISEILGGRRLKSPVRCYFNRAERAMTVKRIGVLVECSGAEWRQNDNLLIPYAIRSSLLTACLTVVLTMCRFGNFIEIMSKCLSKIKCCVQTVLYAKVTGVRNILLI